MSDREFFDFFHYRWDITKARQIADGLPVRQFNAEPWFGWLGLIWIETDHIAAADLSRPILVALIREMNNAPLIIDGWHRLARAQREGVTTLLVVVLDEDQEYAVRIYGGDKGLPFIR